MTFFVVVQRSSNFLILLQGRPKGEAAQALTLGPTKNKIFKMHIRPPKTFVHMIYRPRDQNFA
jgi:hypothetical protein